VEGVAPINGCPPGGADTNDKNAAAMGVTAEASEKMVAVVNCQGDNVKAKDKYLYLGIRDCRTAQQLAGGPKQCPGGCVGLATCAKVCPFDAIEITAQGLAVVNREKCTGCQKCVSACPRQVISMAPYSATVHVLCNSHDKGPLVKKYCEVGCIACTLCKKAAPEAYAIENFLAHVVYDKREGAEAGVEKCPTKCIRDLATQGYPEGSSLKMPGARV
jgi:electron transport complex protein RnfB